MKVYTKTGDQGETSLIGGSRISKIHPQIEAYGTIDELMSYVALLRDMEVSIQVKDDLLFILDRLMTCASVMARGKDAVKIILPEIDESDIIFLERGMDEMEKELPPLNSFILPGGHIFVSHCHIARTVCRRAERSLLKVEEQLPGKEMTGKFLNRLSDYFFVLSRKIARDVNAEQLKWEPRKK